MQKTRPLLSIGMIVKNEMRCLQKCLDALAPLRAALPCELVIADTGSTDGTRELAAQYADILFDYAWCDDFAAARNAVIGRCHGLWHLQVDADEYLDADFSQLTDFLKSRESKNCDLGLVVVRNYGSLDMREDDYADFQARRLLRIASGLRYEGAIHEAPVKGPNTRSRIFERIVFHHDGYAMRESAAKRRRNLAILEKELEKEPRSLRRAVQCLESSDAPEDMRKYALMALRLAESEDAEKETAVYWRIAAFHDAVTLTLRHAFPEIPQWAARGRELYPDSIAIGAGVSFTCARYRANLGEYEKACGELELYFKTLERYNRGDYDALEFQVIPVHAVSVKIQRKARLLQIQCLGLLERWEALTEAFEACLAFEEAHGGLPPQGCLGALLELWKNDGAEAERLFKRMYALMEAGKKQELHGFLMECRIAFRRVEADAARAREAWRLFLCLGEGCELGRFAHIMDSYNAARVEALLAAVEAPELMPPELFVHALSIDAALPESLFRMKAEDIAALAAGVAALLCGEPRRALELLAMEHSGDPGMALWGFHAASELAARVDWMERGSAALFDFYCERMEDYLDLFCPPALRTDENAYALPARTRFAHHCLQAREAWRREDERAYTRRLREALAACPAMKDMVSYLADRAATLRERAAASPELLELAERIRAILALYPSDDPAVQTLKNSAEYKLVARLIEA